MRGPFPIPSRPQERLENLQASRDEVQAKIEAQSKDYAALLNKCQAERQQHADWLSGERAERDQQNEKYQRLHAELNALKAELVHKDHLIQSRNMSLEQLELQREDIITDHRTSIEQMLVCNN